MIHLITVSIMKIDIRNFKCQLKKAKKINATYSLLGETNFGFVFLLYPLCYPNLPYVYSRTMNF